MNGVQEVYLYCGRQTDQVEEYVNQSRWAASSRSSPFSIVQFVRVADARSAGDVLRDLDTRALVDGDFVLVHGDVVSNIMLDGILAEHRKRREENAGNIMTMVLRSGGSENHRTKTNGITPVFVVDTKNKRCLHYEEMSPLQEDHYALLDPAIVEELSTDFEVRADLIDAQIDICTPEVLALWSESFDYELPRRNFLHGVLKDWELNGKMIYAEIVDEGYAARASNLQMYDAISRDILSRWTFPFLPENNLAPKQAYRRHPNSVVLECSTTHAPDAKLSHSVIGAQTSLGSGSQVTNSIIGSRCKIGANVTLQNVIIWDDVTIQDGTTITQSILAEGVQVGKGSTIGAGSLLASGVKVGENAKLPENSVISTLDGNGRAVAAADTALLGANSSGATFHDPDADELDERDPARLQTSLIYSLANANISTSSVSTLSSDISSDEDQGDFLTPGSSSFHTRSGSTASEDSIGKLSFHTDAVHGLLDALRVDSGDFDSAKLEFMGLRLANNASDSMMRKAVATAFVRRAAELLTPEHGSLEPSKAAERALTACNGATKFIDEVGVGGGEDEQVEYILATQHALEHVKNIDPAKAGTLLAALMQQLYALDILEEEGILAWWTDDRAVSGDAMAALKDKCRVLVEWLENAEEEEDDSDEDSD